MLLLLSVAYAHPNDLPHLHGDDPAAVALLVAWLVAGVIYAGVAHRGVRNPSV